MLTAAAAGFGTVVSAIRYCDKVRLGLGLSLGSRLGSRLCLGLGLILEF